MATAQTSYEHFSNPVDMVEHIDLTIHHLPLDEDPEAVVVIVFPEDLQDSELGGRQSAHRRGVRPPACRLIQQH